MSENNEQSILVSLTKRGADSADQYLREMEEDYNEPEKSFLEKSLKYLKKRNNIKNEHKQQIVSDFFVYSMISFLKDCDIKEVSRIKSEKNNKSPDIKVSFPGKSDIKIECTVAHGLNTFNKINPNDIQRTNNCVNKNRGCHIQINENKILHNENINDNGKNTYEINQNLQELQKQFMIKIKRILENKKKQLESGGIVAIYFPTSCLFIHDIYRSHPSWREKIIKIFPTLSQALSADKPQNHNMNYENLLSCRVILCFGFVPIEFQGDQIITNATNVYSMSRKENGLPWEKSDRIFIGLDDASWKKLKNLLSY